MSKYKTINKQVSGFTLTEVIIAAALSILIGLFAVDQLRQLSFVKEKSVDSGKLTGEREALHGVIDYIFRRSLDLRFTPLQRNAANSTILAPAPNPLPLLPFPNHTAQDPFSVSTPNRYQLGNHGAIVFQSDLSVCTDQGFDFAPVNVPGPANRVIIICCGRTDLTHPLILNNPGGINIINNQPISVDGPAINNAQSACTQEPGGLSIEFRRTVNGVAANSSICISGVTELNVQEAGFVSRKNKPEEITTFYFLDIWTEINTKIQPGQQAPLPGFNEKLSMITAIDYPPVDCHESIPKIRGYVPR
ncbi:MAG: hypothetical protein HY843_06695 [Bdellovibrio sp.]|nr:hypothetical protein [Bdellovibrio sp.]